VIALRERLGLIDEYHLWVLPAAVGSGAALFAGLDHLLPLRLVSSRAFRSGILELPRRYIIRYYHYGSPVSWDE